MASDLNGRPPDGLGHYLRDVIYGASDGVVTTMAVVAGATGAAFDAKVGLVLGFANLAADGLSMGASNYLGLKSELEQAGASVANEKPLRHGVATFIAFVLAGGIPLLAYLPVVNSQHRLFVALLLAAVTLIVVGVGRARFIRRSIWRSAGEMLIITGLASAAAYVLGLLIAPLL
jgi:VIT1/CCC1 family predicted Fe2+/Mn2+ transporter